MNVVFVSRCDYSLLTENMAAAFSQIGHDVSVFDLKRYRLQDKYISKDYSRKRLKAFLNRVKPEMVFVVAPLFLTVGILEEVGTYRLKQGGLLVGWIGDIFEQNDENKNKCSHFDRLYVTDTHIITFAGLDEGAYLPLATDPDLFKPQSSARDIDCSFVASHTDNRSSFLAEAQSPIHVYGPGWNEHENHATIHSFSSGGISLKATSRIYAKSKTVVNLKNSVNVVNGLNQRSFDPCASGAVLFHDYIADLERHFDLEKEIVVFHDVEDFEAGYERIISDPESAIRIAEAGRRRVLSEHTYLHRAQAVLDDLSL